MSCFLVLFYHFRPVLGYDIALESDGWSTIRGLCPWVYGEAVAGKQAFEIDIHF